MVLCIREMRMTENLSSGLSFSICARWRLLLNLFVRPSVRSAISKQQFADEIRNLLVCGRSFLMRFPIPLGKRYG